MSETAARKVFSFNRALGGGIGGEFPVLLRHYQDVSVTHSSLDDAAVQRVRNNRACVGGIFFLAVDIPYTLFIDLIA